MSESKLREALRICKETRKTDFYTNPIAYKTPWENKDLVTAKLISIDYTNKTAEVQTRNDKITSPIKMSTAKLETLYEIGNYYGITAFLDVQGNLVDYSYITQDMITVKTYDGVDVYE